MADTAAGGRAGIQIGVLVSGHGRGSNLQALMDACASGHVPGRVAVVIGTRSDAPALERARDGGADAVVVSPRKYAEDQDGYADALMRALTSRGVDLICLAGYMRILPPSIVDHFAGRIMNVHPALLPLFGGKGMYGEHVHRAVIESGMKVSGATVHFVDEQYDNGPIIVQTAVAVLEDDTPETLAARVLKEEHRNYADAVRLFALGRLRIEDRRVRVLPES